MGNRMGQPVVVVAADATPEDTSAVFAAGVAAATAEVAADAADTATAVALVAAEDAALAQADAAEATSDVEQLHSRIDVLQGQLLDVVEDILEIIDSGVVDPVVVDDGAPPVVTASPDEPKTAKKTKQPKGFGFDGWFGSR